MQYFRINTHIIHVRKYAQNTDRPSVRRSVHSSGDDNNIGDDDDSGVGGLRSHTEICDIITHAVQKLWKNLRLQNIMKGCATERTNNIHNLICAARNVAGVVMPPGSPFSGVIRRCRCAMRARISQMRLWSGFGMRECDSNKCPAMRSARKTSTCARPCFVGGVHT